VLSDTKPYNPKSINWSNTRTRLERSSTINSAHHVFLPKKTVLSKLRPTFVKASSTIRCWPYASIALLLLLCLPHPYQDRWYDDWLQSCVWFSTCCAHFVRITRMWRDKSSTNDDGPVTVHHLIIQQHTSSCCYGLIAAQKHQICTNLEAQHASKMRWIYGFVSLCYLICVCHEDIGEPWFHSEP